MAQKFKTFTTVRLVGLSNEKFNGKLALVAEDESDGRYLVRLCESREHLLDQRIRVKPKNMILVCDYCFAIGENMQVCGKCKMVRYCDAKCQHRDWVRHKPECKRLRYSRLVLKSELHDAASRGQLDKVKKLIQEGASLDKTTRDGTTPFFFSDTGRSLRYCEIFSTARS